MNNQLTKLNDLNSYIENMDEQQLEMIQKKIYEMQFKRLDRALSEVADQVNKLEEARKNRQRNERKTIRA